MFAEQLTSKLFAIEYAICYTWNKWTVLFWSNITEKIFLDFQCSRMAVGVVPLILQNDPSNKLLLTSEQKDQEKEDVTGAWSE